MLMGKTPHHFKESKLGNSQHQDILCHPKWCRFFPSAVVSWEMVIILDARLRMGLICSKSGLLIFLNHLMILLYFRFPWVKKMLESRVSLCMNLEIFNFNVDFILQLSCQCHVLKLPTWSLPGATGPKPFCWHLSFCPVSGSGGGNAETKIGVHC